MGGGRALSFGRLHQTGRKRPFTFRPDIGLAEYLFEPRRTEDAALIPSGQKAAFLKATDTLPSAVTECWRTGFRYRCDCTAIVMPATLMA